MIPERWGSSQHRQQVVENLERRSHHLDNYIRGITQFAAWVDGRTSRSMMN
jgi:hypothetical protein